METKNIYPIKAVSNRTGLSSHVIRAWEKRYSAIEPGRTDTNRRLYSEDDIKRLKLLAAITKSGHSIGTIANLPNEELEKISVTESGSNGTVKLNEDETTNEFLRLGMIAIENLDQKYLEEILGRASVDLSQPDLIENVLLPIIKKIGDNWKNGHIRIYHEHLASAVISTFLANLRGAYQTHANAPEIIIATPYGQRHELGALLVAASAASEGWKVTYLGSNLPAEEIVAAVNQNKARVLALSLVYPPDDPKVNEELIKISRFLPKDTFIYTGGNAAESYKKTLSEIKAKLITDIDEFRNELVEIRKNKNG